MFPLKSRWGVSVKNNQAICWGKSSWNGKARPIWWVHCVGRWLQTPAQATCEGGLFVFCLWVKHFPNFEFGRQLAAVVEGMDSETRRWCLPSASSACPLPSRPAYLTSLCADSSFASRNIYNCISYRLLREFSVLIGVSKALKLMPGTEWVFNKEQLLFI